MGPRSRERAYRAYTYPCSECEAAVAHAWSYCPNCGVELDG